MAGGDAVNSTDLTRFQEPHSNAEVNVTKICFIRTGKRTFKFGDKHLQLSKKVNLKIESLQIDTTNKQNFTQNTKLWRIYSVCICIFIRLGQHYGASDYNSKNNRIVPKFAGNYKFILFHKHFLCMKWVILITLNYEILTIALSIKHW